jgi:hypothetical protein
MIGRGTELPSELMMMVCKGCLVVQIPSAGRHYRKAAVIWQGFKFSLMLVMLIIFAMW